MVGLAAFSMIVASWETLEEGGAVFGLVVDEDALGMLLEELEETTGLGQDGRP